VEAFEKEHEKFLVPKWRRWAGGGSAGRQFDATSYERHAQQVKIAEASRELLATIIDSAQLGDALALLEAGSSGGGNNNKEEQMSVLVTLEEWKTLSPRKQGYIIYMQANLPGSELKHHQKNPYPPGSQPHAEWNEGEMAAVLQAQDEGYRIYMQAEHHQKNPYPPGSQPHAEWNDVAAVLQAQDSEE
jgi:hypothetical protein